MMHVDLQPNAPVDFKATVATPGARWLRKQSWYQETTPTAEQAVPKGTFFPPYWRKALPALHDAYHGICAYLGIYIDRAIGAASVDHFKPKTHFPGLAYTWSNYRLSSLSRNRRKGVHFDIIDPCEIAGDWFVVEPDNGALAPNPDLPQEMKDRVRKTIDELGLDEEDCRKMRLHFLAHYLKGDVSAHYLEQYAPYLWHEVQRQNLQPLSLMRP